MQQSISNSNSNYSDFDFKIGIDELKIHDYVIYFGNNKNKELECKMRVYKKQK